MFNSIDLVGKLNMFIPLQIHTLSNDDIWQAGPDRLGLSDPHHIAAACLYQIHALGSGDRQIYDIADAGKGALVASLRRIGMLKAQFQTASDEAQELFKAGDDHDNQSTMSMWHQWRDKEWKTRLAWAIFEYDCTLSTLTNRRGTIDVHEVPGRLPCAEALWEAQTAQLWRALAAVRPTQLPGHPLPAVLKRLVSHGTLPDDATSWSKRLCAQVVTRQLWDLKRIELASMPDFLGLPHIVVMHQPASNLLLQALTCLRNSMLTPTSASEIVHTQ